MARELNEPNLKEAFFKMLGSTAIGKAESPNREELLGEKVKKAVPKSMCDTYPARLLASARQVCTNEPYVWRVDSIEPEIDDTTTFGILYTVWFRMIVWPV